MNVWLVLGLNIGRVHFLNFLGGPMILKHKKCNSRGLMGVYVGFIMLTAYFCHSPQSQVEYNCALITVDWLAACIALREVGAILVVLPF